MRQSFQRLLQFYHVFSAAYSLNRLYVVLDAGSASNIEGHFFNSLLVINPTISNFVIESSSSPTAPTYPDNSEFNDIVNDYKESEEALNDSIDGGLSDFKNMINTFGTVLQSFTKPLLLVTNLFVEFTGSSDLYNDILFISLVLGFISLIFSVSYALISHSSSKSSKTSKSSRKGGGR